MNLPNADQANAFSRHIVSYAAGGVTMFAALHLISGGDAQSAADAINMIGDGVSKIITGVGILAPIAMGAIAALSANPLVQLLKGATAVTNHPEIAAKAPAATQAAIATAADVVAKTTESRSGA